MAIHDPIADFLTIVRNGVKAEKLKVIAKRSKLVINILKVLKQESFIFDFKEVEDGNQGTVVVYLRVPGSIKGVVIRKLRHLERVSRPGLRRYSEAKKMPLELNGLGINVLTTSKGVMTGRQAYKQKVGGEILLRAW